MASRCWDFKEIADGPGACRWMSAIRRAIPHLRSMGWNHLRVISWTDDEVAYAAAAECDVLITGYLNRLHSIVARFPTKYYVLIDKGDAATLALPHFPASGTWFHVLSPSTKRPCNRLHTQAHLQHTCRHGCPDE